MAVTQVTMPQLGESVTEGTIGKWLKQPGDTRRKVRVAGRGDHRQGERRDTIARGGRHQGAEGRRGRDRAGWHRDPCDRRRCWRQRRSTRTAARRCRGASSGSHVGARPNSGTCTGCRRTRSDALHRRLSPNDHGHSNGREPAQPPMDMGAAVAAAMPQAAGRDLYSGRRNLFTCIYGWCRDGRGNPAPPLDPGRDAASLKSTPST